MNKTEFSKMSRQNPYQQGTYGASPYGFQMPYGQQQFQSYQPVQSMQSYGFNQQSNGHLIYRDTTRTVQTTCYKCRSFGHYANECPY